MSWFPRPSSPLAAIADLRAFLRQRSREQVIGAGLALLVTSIIVVEFIIDASIGTTPPPSIIYVQTYAANRSDADIIADQKKDEAKRQAALADRRREYRKLENQLGM